LGKPVWLLNRYGSEWRWLLGREDSQWYPSMRIFNQPAMHDWASVMSAVARELEKLVAEKSSRTMMPAQWQAAARDARKSLGIVDAEGGSEKSSGGIATRLKSWFRR
jgi:hypothetical protein